MEICGARVLMTHTQVQDIMGSTVVALDVATYLVNHGAQVEVYAGAASAPALDLFEERGVPVNCDINHHYNLADYDLIWVQSQVLPLSLIDQLSEVQSTDVMPAFVFNHMSALDLASDEQPYLYMLEERLTSKSLYVSPETRDKLAPFYHVPPAVTGILANPAPRGYADLPDRNADTDTPRNVVIVSNHVPAELWESIELLEQQNVTVTVVGAQGQYGFVTPDMLNRYDAVIIIGKTVQYCLTAGIPVYVYDHFGGFGYLNELNFEAAASNNFSGRGGERFTAEIIAASIIDDYHEATQYATTNRKHFIDLYCIDNVLPTILADVNPRVVEPFGKPYQLAMKAAQRFAHRYFETWALMSTTLPERDGLRRDVDVLRHDVEEVRRDNERLTQSLRERNDDVSRLSSRVREIEESESFKIGRLLMIVPHAVKAFLGRVCTVFRSHRK